MPVSIACAASTTLSFKTGNIQLINIINNNKYELYGIIICQKDIYETNIKNAKNINKLLDDSLEWLYIEIDKLNDVDHISLLCKIFKVVSISFGKLTSLTTNSSKREKFFKSFIIFLVRSVPS